jgi:hypothetical protein
MTTVRKLSVNQTVDSAAVLRKLATIRGEAKEVRDVIRLSIPPLISTDGWNNYSV